jgi:tetratricopeptide (TPR) repeat protein
VAEKLLHRADICAALQEVCGEGVPHGNYLHTRHQEVRTAGVYPRAGRIVASACVFAARAACVLCHTPPPGHGGWPGLRNPAVAEAWGDGEDTLANYLAFACHLRDGGLGGKLPHDETWGMAMGFRLYKSVKLGKGVRLNLSKTGVGVSAGVRGARYSVHSSGRTTRTVGVPGTGVYYRSDTYSKGGRSAATGRTGAPVEAPPVYPKAGVLAPREEKRFVQGVTAYMQGWYAEGLDAFQDVGRRDTRGAHVGEEFFAGMCLVGLERPDDAIPYFETVLASDYAIPDPLMTKYHIGGAMQVNVTAAVSVMLPMSNLATALILAEAYQQTGERRKAIELLESLGATAKPGETVFALSLADLYFDEDQWDDVVRVTEGVMSNEDDSSLNILAFRAYALNEKGITDAALAVTKECLRSKKRSPSLLHFARYIRGRAYENAGKASMARKEFEKVFAEDAGFADIAQRLGMESSSASVLPLPPPPDA